MFLLGILVAVVAMAVIRTQQVLLTSPTKDSGITNKSYKGLRYYSALLLYISLRSG